jgi:uncharacterized protein YjiS (DUF1127 family)
MNVVAINVPQHKSLEGLRASLQLIGKTFATWRARTRERRQLAAMSAADLKDIGLTRADIRAEANKEFWQA